MKFQDPDRPLVSALLTMGSPVWIPIQPGSLQRAVKGVHRARLRFNPQLTVLVEQAKISAATLEPDG